jgi:hypothetical protein
MRGVGYCLVFEVKLERKINWQDTRLVDSEIVSVACLGSRHNSARDSCLQMQSMSSRVCSIWSSLYIAGEKMESLWNHPRSALVMELYFLTTLLQ